MAYWDLTHDDRARLMQSLMIREEMRIRDIDLPRELTTETLKKQYGLTDAELNATIKGMKNDSNF